MVRVTRGKRTGAGRIAIGAVVFLSFLLAGCDSPLLNAVSALREDAAKAAVQNAQNDLTAFSIKDPAVIGTISGTDITVIVPPDTDVTNLVAIFTITGASVTVNDVTQTSNVTINDFTNPVGYLVAAVDGNTKLYTVTVTLNKTLPVLTATAVSSASITTTTAAGGGTITSGNGNSITASGICWSTSQKPTIDTCTGYTTDGPTSAGSWSTSSMTGLTAGTTYYVRAYATNAKGTGYGPQVSFTTVPAAPAMATLAAVGGSDGSGELSVSWSAVTGATLYEVYCSTSNDITTASQPTGGTDVSGVSCTVSGLMNYTAYYVWVFAKNGSGTSAASPSNNCVVGKPVTAITLQRQADTQTISGGRTSDNFVYYSQDTLVATVSPSDATNTGVTWSSNNSYASVSTSGLITAGSSAGTATITATAADGQGASATCTTTVTSNAVGQTGPGGGKIILDQGSYVAGGVGSATRGWRYLETAVASTSRHGSWGWYSSALSMSLSTAVGYGPSNTTQLLAAFGGTTTTAAYVAHAYRDSATGGVFSDWFLPSSGEMDTAHWRTYASVPQYYAAWSSFGASDGDGGYIYSNGCYNLNETVGWVWATPTADPNNSFLVIPMRRF